VSVRTKKRTFVVLAMASALALSACGGSDSESSDTSVSADSVAKDDTAPGGDLEAFCADATDAENAANIPDNADAAAVAEQMNVQAQRLSELASTAPADVKGDVELLAKAAADMAAALAEDPTLENFDAVVESFATEEVNTASTNVEAFLSENCGASE
jgi:hypothetical protein